MTALAPCAIALLLGAGGAPVGSPEAALAAVLEKRPVRLEVPFEFRRRGAAARATEAVLFRVAVQDPGAFAPRGVPEPLFVYGRGVCRTLQSPFVGHDAIVLCALPARKEPAVLWLTRAGLPELRDRAMDAEFERAAAAASRRAIEVPPPSPSARPLRVRDADALQRATFRARILPAPAPQEKPTRPRRS